jgi:hypothetical protein
MRSCARIRSTTLLLSVPTIPNHLRAAITHYPHAVLILVDDYNILPYLYAADTLIVLEASGTMVDFVTLDKIGIIFVLPSASLQHHDGASLLDEDPQHFLEGAFLLQGERLRDGDTCGGHYPRIA